jgi:hypothetical protein
VNRSTEQVVEKIGCYENIDGVEENIPVEDRKKCCKLVVWQS